MSWKKIMHPLLLFLVIDAIISQPLPVKSQKSVVCIPYGA